MHKAYRIFGIGPSSEGEIPTWQLVPIHESVDPDVGVRDTKAEAEKAIRSELPIGIAYTIVELYVPLP